MATRDLRFNIFANDRASAAFARISAAAEALASTITRVDGRRARVRVEADTTEAEAKLARAEAKLDELNRRRSSPTIDADIKLFEAKIVKATSDLAALSREEATPEVDVAIAKAESDILKFREKIEALNREKASPRVEADIAQAQAEVERLREQLDYMNRHGTEIDIRSDTRKVVADIDKLKERLAELQRFRPNVDVDLDVANANHKIRTLEEDLAQLARVRVSPTVDADIDKAQRDIGRLEAQLESLGRQTPTPLIRLHTAQVEAQLASLRAQLRDLENQRTVPLRIEGIKNEIAAIKAQITELNSMRATPKIEIETARALTKLAFLEAKLAAIKDRDISITLNERFGRGANSMLGYLNEMRRGFQNNINAAAQLMRNVRQLFLPVSSAGLLPALASLGASLSEMVGIIGLLPAVAGFAGASIATLAIGFNGLADAIGPRDTGAQIKKAELAMSRLGEEAQKVARVVIGFKDEWNGLKNAVQDALFDDLSITLQSLGKQWIPVLQAGLSKLGTSFNGVAKEINVFMRDSRTVDDVNRLFSMFGMTIDNLGPGFRNVLEAFTDSPVEP